MSALEVLLRNFFEQASNSAGVIDSHLRWRKFCNKLNASGILCSEADRDALERLWTQHTVSRRVHIGAAVSSSMPSGSSSSSSSLDATPDLSFASLLHLLEQAFAPSFRADVEQVLERGAAVSKIWNNDPSRLPADMSQNDLRRLATRYEEAAEKVRKQLRDDPALQQLDYVGLAQLNAYEARRMHCRRYQQARSEDIRRQLRVQRLPMQKMTQVLRGTGIRGVSGPAAGAGQRRHQHLHHSRTDLFGLLGASVAANHHGRGSSSRGGAVAGRGGFFCDPPPSPAFSSASSGGQSGAWSGRVVPVQRGFGAASGEEEDDVAASEEDGELYQLVEVKMHDFTVFRRAANCYAAHRELTFSPHALRCCGESNTAVSGSTVFAYSNHSDPVRVSTILTKVGRFDKSDHVFYKIAAAMLQAMHDVHIMTTHHIEQELDLDNFVLVGRGQRLLLAGVAWGDNFHGLHHYSGEQYEVDCRLRDGLLLRSVVACLRRMLGMSTRVERHVRVRGPDSTFRISCGDTLRVTVAIPKRWCLANHHDDGPLVGASGASSTRRRRRTQPVTLAVEYAGTTRAKRCAEFVRCSFVLPTTKGRQASHATARPPSDREEHERIHSADNSGNHEAVLEFETKVSGLSVWRVRPLHNRFSGDFLTVTLQITPRAKTSSFEDFAEVALDCATRGDFDKAWNHEFLQDILSKRPV